MHWGVRAPRRARRVAWLRLALPITFALAQVAAAEPGGPPIEEVRVTAFGGCGPWPIAHQLIATCSYAELDSEHLDAVRALREEMFAMCIVCEDGTCRPRDLDARSEDQVRLCGQIFWTPTRVGVIEARFSAAKELVVDFTYAISPRGRVTDIEITYLSSDLRRERVLDMIRRGAEAIEFEPVMRDDAAVAIVGLEDGFSLLAR